ncbi:MAG: tRNA (N(6)-L-threonylcarbamoyladenosine(37)-C(2))-methylthiotransferase MtaB [Ruminococcaceae bacterium]|nr:tRNA (N(6)-L-threonylcarbamoyladenosine(37)-C(2))-methylthiotransferase MtaB [Oscillospiraceae bacterium]
MKFAFYTLGCKANQFDTQALAQFCTARGHQVVSWQEAADVYVVNTCTVTAESDRKSRQMVRGARRRAPEAVVGICGCFSQVSPEAAGELGADVICGTRDREEFLRLLEAAAAERTPKTHVIPYTLGVPFEELPSGGFDGRTRALLKVQDGCDNYCTYCIIPYSRGHIRSLPLSAAAREVQKLRDEGYLEVVLTGIEISSYGRDFHDGTGLADLLETICHAAPEVRMHLGSLEPRTVTEEFCRRIAALPNLLPHFHLSLQSGCDETLRRMHRRYTTARFLESATLLRQYFPQCGITADLITGFPGETEEEFAETLSFLRTCIFSDMHVFPYSERPGTPAAAMTQLPRALREQRAHEAAAVAAELRQTFLLTQIGREEPVLFEADRNGVQQGHTTNYLPISVLHTESLKGRILPVRITDVEGDQLTGELKPM